MKNDTVVCPLVDTDISIDECMENRDIKDEYIPKEFKKKDNWKEICKNCKYYNY